METAQDVLKRIKDATNQFRILSLNRQIEACEGLFTESPLIDVAILGQFKAGKSSFINSLIGKPILPVGVIPVTTVITRLQYGKNEKAIVTQFDGTSKDVEIHEIEGFISEAQNPANKLNVDVVDVELPSLEHYRGLRLVDTPGLGSIYKYNTATSKQWLPEVGAAIVAISADRPLSENDINLIQELMTYTPKVVLLLTKADLLTEDQQKEVVQFFKTTLKREFKREFPIFLYSTITQTELFKHWLDKFLLNLSQNRDMEFKNIVQHKIRSLARSCIGYLEIALKTSTQADYDCEQLKKLILDEKVNYELIQSELFLIARENMLQTRTLIANRLEASQRVPLIQKILSSLSNEMPTWQGNLWKLTRQYENWLMETMASEMNNISNLEHKHFFGTLKKAQLSISRSVELFRNLLDKNIEQVLGIKLEEVDWKIEVSEPPHPDVAFVRTFDFNLDLLWFLFPMFIFRGVFERQFLKKIPQVADIHLSRLAYQWEVRINKTIEDVKEQALAYVRDELSTIDALLSQVSGRTDEIRQMVDLLQRQQEMLTNTNNNIMTGEGTDGKIRDIP